MHTYLFKGLTQEEKAARTKQIKASKETLNLFIEVIEQFRPKRHPSYESPSWAYEQAHDNGINETINRVVSLLTVK